MIIHLLPEQLACIGIVSIVETIMVTRTYPVLQAIFNRLLIDPSVLIKFFVVLGSNIELRPYGNHHPTMHGMNGIDHCLRIGETFLIELMTSPRIFRPMQPVEHDIINRNIPVAETFQGPQHFI